MRLGLRAKVTGSCLFIVLLLIGISTYSIFQLKNIDRAYSLMFSERMEKVANSFNAQKESLNKGIYAVRQG